MSRHGLALVGLLVLGIGGSSAAEDRPGKVDLAEQLARRVWAATEVVLKQHLQPPERAKMLRAAVGGLPGARGKKAPADLDARAAKIQNGEQLAALFRELWPDAAKASERDRETVEDDVAVALGRSVPGSLQLIRPSDLRAVEQISGNRYEGTGIQLAMNAEEKLARIVATFPGSPARRGGMKPGDLILKVDDTDCKGLTLRQVVDLLRGAKGSDLTVIVRQPDAKQERSIQMTRGVVPFDTLAGYRRAGEESWDHRIDPAVPVAYVMVKAINAGTLHELRRLERRLQGEGVSALVLDLRFTGEAQAHDVGLVADAFLEDGVLWRERGRDGRLKELRADRDCLFRGWPVALLINDERPHTGVSLLTAALTDNGRRAVLVGGKAAGSGYLNSLVRLPEGLGAVTLRSSAVERVTDSPREWTIPPDHAVTLTKEQRKALNEWGYSQELARPAAQAVKAPLDPQLAKAVEVLQAALKDAK